MIVVSQILFLFYLLHKVFSDDVGTSLVYYYYYLYLY